MVAIIKKGFPIELLKPEMSILCLFSAAFYGNNDIQFIHGAGCRNVLLMDNDKAKLAATAQRFDYGWSCIDIYEYLETKPMETFDIVLSDQWSNQDEKIHVTHFNQLKRMARKYLILGCTDMWLKGNYPSPGEYYKRSDFNGGVYWRVICV